MRVLNTKQKKMLDVFIEAYHEGSGGNYPLSVDNMNPWAWAELEKANDHETLYQNANRYIMDKVMSIRYGKNQ
jgi:hypothetical protein